METSKLKISLLPLDIRHFKSLVPATQDFELVKNSHLSRRQRSLQLLLPKNIPISYFVLGQVQNKFDLLGCKAAKHFCLVNFVRGP